MHTHTLSLSYTHGRESNTQINVREDGTLFERRGNRGMGFEVNKREEKGKESENMLMVVVIRLWKREIKSG